MRHLPNDTISIINSDPIDFLYADAFAISGNDVGGNDTITITNLFSSGYVVYGDAFNMYDSTQGGNDTITNFNSGDSSSSSLSGDAGFMYGSAEGGNDTITATNSVLDDGVRPIIFYRRGGTCERPYVMGLTIMVNSIFNSWRVEDACV
jgi:hypothetical protein